MSDVICLSDVTMCSSIIFTIDCFVDGRRSQIEDDGMKGARQPHGGRWGFSEPGVLFLG